MSKFHKMLGTPERLKWVREMNLIQYRHVKITLGENTKIHPTVTLGDPGESLAVDGGEWVRCQHHGDVVIEDGVHIDAHSTVKRATLPGTATIIGRGSKLCSYVNVGHNCKIGEQVFIGPHVCLNGSVEIGPRSWISGHAVIEQGRKIGEGAVVGMGAVVTEDVPPFTTVVGIPAVPIKFVGNYVHPSFIYGDNLKIGKYNHIHEGVVVGDDVRIRSYVELRKDTVFGDRCYIDSGVKSSGQCKIGNDVRIRYDTILSRNLIIEDNVFLSPQVMFIKVTFRGEKPDKPTTIRKGVIIGTNATVYAGVEIAESVIIGAKAMVARDCLEPGMVYRASSEIVAKRR